MGLKSKVVGGDEQQDEGLVSSEALEREGQPVDGAAAPEELIKLQAEVLDLKDKYLRSLADFENFRKRTAKERSELIKYQGESILVDVLEVVDSFERALENPGGDLEKFKEGVKLIYKQFVDVLGKWEVRGESSIGKDFDPNQYRAIGKARIEGQKPNVIIGELKKSYMYKDKLLRVGEVMVNEGPAAVEQEDIAAEAQEAREGN
ncbi:MAG: nucleotide exchange factor GrpE [Proteobacteria bacterium]|nr:nucleotide exchange factor GrpE [Pseudomonadota bacterium]